MIWCLRDDGQIAVMVYERDQNVYSWSRIVTRDGDEFESIAVVYGGIGSEDEVWCTVKRSVNGSTVRYVERFKTRDWGSDQDDCFFVDSGYTYDSTSTSTITGLSHLEGETVVVLGDGIAQTAKTVSGGQITLDSAASTVQVGLPYTSTLKPMKLDIANLGLGTVKRVTNLIINMYETHGIEFGPTTDDMENVEFSGTDLYTGSTDAMSFAGKFEQEGDIIIRQTDPLPATILSITADVEVN